MHFLLRFPFLVLCFLTLVQNRLQAQSTAAVPVECLPRGGLFDAPVSVMLFCATPGAVIRYTLDGAEPDTLSMLYSGVALTFDVTAVLRARAFAPGLAPSPATTHTYFIGLKHHFPVLSLVFEPAAFFDSLNGIYVRYDQDLNAVVNIEFFENGADTASFNQLAEVEIQGTGSTSQPQKSLEIKAKKSLGADRFKHGIFPDLPFADYKRFVLRNGGQDWCVLQFRDEFATSLLFDRSDLGGILREPALHLQAWRPAVVYLNGQYWGIHNLRERMNRFYVRQHLDWEENEFDMIENYSGVSSGDSAAWFQFFYYLWQTETGFENDSVFEEIKQHIDYQNFLDYCIFHVYLENEDWPGKNVLRFRHRSEAGKWRWMTYDLDFTFGLFQQNGGWNTGDPSPDALARLLNGSSLLWPNPDWATLPFRRCWQNAGFRRDFANRLADMLNTAFLPARVSRCLDEFRALYQPEIAQHYVRWWFGNFEALWLDNVEKARHFGLNRPYFARQEILHAMPEASGLSELTVDVFPPGGGRVEVSTLRPSGDQLPWSGIYFNGVPVPVKAVANPGYQFIGWSKPLQGQADSTGILLQASTALVAYFQAVDTSFTDIDEPLPASFDLYPNPAKQRLTVYGPALEEDLTEVQVTNSGGVLLLRECRSPDAGGCFSLNVADLPAGVYFLKIKGEKGSGGVRRFVVKGH